MSLIEQALKRTEREIFKNDTVGTGSSFLPHTGDKSPFKGLDRRRWRLFLISLIILGFVGIGAFWRSSIFFHDDKHLEMDRTEGIKMDQGWNDLYNLPSREGGKGGAAIPIRSGLTKNSVRVKVVQEQTPVKVSQKVDKVVLVEKGRGDKKTTEAVSVKDDSRLSVKNVMNPSGLKPSGSKVLTKERKEDRKRNVLNNRKRTKIISQQPLKKEKGFYTSYIPKNGAARNLFDMAKREAEAGNLKQAVSYYQRSVKADPDLKEAYNNMGVLLGELNLLPDAEDSLLKAVEIDPAYDKAYNNLGTIYLGMREFSKAVNQFNMALLLNPRNDKAIVNLGRTYLEIKDPDSALKTFLQGIEEDVILPELYFYMAIVYEMRGEIEMAQRYYKLFLRMANDTNGLDDLRELVLGRTLSGGALTDNR